jgi:hypothetical protein
MTPAQMTPRAKRNTKRRSLERTIVTNSKGHSFRAAGREWCLSALAAPLAKHTSCECCGTAIKRTVRIQNKITKASLIVGTTCYDYLMNGFAANRISRGLISRKDFLRQRQEVFREALGNVYRSYFADIDLGSWRRWFLSIEGEEISLAKPVRTGIKELRTFGCLVSLRLLTPLVFYHDSHRRFPRQVLLPADWQQWAPNAPDVLTMNEGRALSEEIEQRRDQFRKLGQPLTDAGTKNPGARLREFVARVTLIADAQQIRGEALKLVQSSEVRTYLAGLYLDFGSTTLHTSAVAGDLLWSPSSGFMKVEARDGHAAPEQEHLRTIRVDNGISARLAGFRSVNLSRHYRGRLPYLRRRDRKRP